MRVRRFGKSYAHPLVVLVVMPSPGSTVQIGISASRTVGKAFERNKGKRMLREAIRPFLPKVKAGWHIILIARKPMLTASLSEIQDGLLLQLRKANLLLDSNATSTQP
jgi:ribonuclease P protein component